MRPPFLLDWGGVEAATGACLPDAALRPPGVVLGLGGRRRAMIALPEKSRGRRKRQTCSCSSSSSFPRPRRDHHHSLVGRGGGIWMGARRRAARSARATEQFQFHFHPVPSRRGARLLGSAGRRGGGGPGRRKGYGVRVIGRDISPVGATGFLSRRFGLLGWGGSFFASSANAHRVDVEFTSHRHVRIRSSSLARTSHPSRSLFSSSLVSPEIQQILLVQEKPSKAVGAKKKTNLLLAPLHA